MKTEKVIISFNNGSVPPPYAYRYEISFSKQTGNANLKIFKGYDSNEELILSESEKFNSDILRQLLSELETIVPRDNFNIIGGSQRIIEIISDNHTGRIEIEPDNEKGISLFNRFLYLYNNNFSDIINKNINL
ncbi:hypothetical protein [Chryseobacterium oryctis]|uniref:Uncharacterized protein n=1 Tax=Chryseobacterium oryctis TaxID=2952618 RepID=A0ABT3HLF8_9FLAO|nr:hypothetical protein [Chryseobacterium oryctis]MCW3160612.1 hypothetical protein [Chryseobacterium oryctis]